MFFYCGCTHLFFCDLQAFCSVLCRSILLRTLLCVAPLFKSYSDRFCWVGYWQSCSFFCEPIWWDMIWISLRTCLFEVKVSTLWALYICSAYSAFWLQKSLCYSSMHLSTHLCMTCSNALHVMVHQAISHLWFFVFSNPLCVSVNLSLKIHSKSLKNRQWFCVSSDSSSWQSVQQGVLLWRQRVPQALEQKAQRVT